MAFAPHWSRNERTASLSSALRDSPLSPPVMINSGLEVEFVLKGWDRVEI
jgi:hypothetical protein